MSELPPELDTALSSLASSMQGMQSTVSMIADEVKRQSSKSDELAQAMVRIERRSVDGREKIAKEFRNGLEKNRECITKSDKTNRAAHERLSREISEAKAEGKKAIEEEVKPIEVRLVEVEKEQTKTRVRDRTIVATISSAGAGILFFFTDGLSRLWDWLGNGS